MSFLGLDWGARFVGYATADKSGLLVTPRGAFERNVPANKSGQLFNQDVENLKKIVSEWEVESIVLGLPLNSDSSESEGSIGMRALANQIMEKLGLPVHLTNEFLSSWEASQNTKDKKNNEHAKSAAIILNQYLKGESQR